MVVTLEFLWIRSIVVCAGTAESADGFARWYSRLLRTVSHIDVSVGDFILFYRAMKTIYRLPKEQSAVAVRGPTVCTNRPIRPAASIFHDRLKRTISIRQTFPPQTIEDWKSARRYLPHRETSMSLSTTPTPRASSGSSSSPPAYSGIRLEPIPTIVARRDPTTCIPPLPDDGSEPLVEYATLYGGLE